MKSHEIWYYFEYWKKYEFDFLQEFDQFEFLQETIQNYTISLLILSW